MATWRSTSSLTAEQRLEVLDLFNRTESELGREAIDEGRRRTVVHRGVGEHWLDLNGDRVRRYALLTPGEPASIEMCGGCIDKGLLEAILSRHKTVDWWTRGDQSTTGGTVVRTLQLLRVALPVRVEHSTIALGEIRTFDPERDALRWLAQNNAAFADHPEQGAWTERQLDERLSEPWFDPSGFFLLEVDGRLAASCWTKVHELHPDRFGEIYVIAVHPDFRGRGLGRMMVLHGLDAIRRKGVSSATLFVDESNVAARALYESLGFTLEREDCLVRFSAVGAHTAD